MSATFWTEDKLVTLRHLLEVEMMSARDAAASFGCTRNAVLGAAMRNKITLQRGRNGCLKGEEVKTRRGNTGVFGGVVQRVKARQKRVPLVFGNLAANVEPFEERSVEVTTEFQCDLTSLNDKSCRYPVSDNSPYLFCGVPEAKVSDGRPYCRCHAELCYIQRKPGLEPIGKAAVRVVAELERRIA